MSLALDQLRAMNTGTVSWQNERTAAGVVQTTDFVGDYDLSAGRWTGRATVKTQGGGGTEKYLKLRYVGDNTVMYASLQGFAEGNRRWMPVDLVGAPGSGTAGIALIDTMAAIRVLEVREADRRYIIGELPARDAVHLLGLNTQLDDAGIRADLLSGFARVELGLTHDNRPATLSLFGSTLQSLSLPQEWRDRAKRLQFSARFEELGKVKVTATLPKDSEVFAGPQTLGGPLGA